MYDDCKTEATYNKAAMDANTKASVSVLAPIETYTLAQNTLRNSISTLKNLNGYRDSEQKIKEYEKSLSDYVKKPRISIK